MRVTKEPDGIQKGSTTDTLTPASQPDDSGGKVQPTTVVEMTNAQDH